ncbi:MAG: M48 family metallopeptidase [Treponema sp.]|nr:M48 family metallopeptidase [Treponema sp.]
MNLVQFTNPFVLIYLIGTGISFLLNHYLEFIDYRARCKNGGVLPKELADIPLAQATFDTEKLKKISDYENAKYFQWIPSSICSLVLDLCLIIFGFYPWLFTMITNFIGGIPVTIGKSFVCFFLFMIFASIPDEILAIPFSLYREFKTEKKFGFSNMTFKLWVTDYLKNTILSLILAALLTIVASCFFVKFPDSWWFILAAVLIAFTFIMQIIYPKFIAPLFNKFEPLPDGEVKDKITEILEKTDFKNGGLFVMDESKRSGHSNAYFSGFGKAKRIVLYDTLIKSLTPDELGAVLGHELGHFKLHHITKRLIFLIPMEFVLLFVLYKLAQFTGLYQGFGFSMVTPENVSSVQFIGLFLAINIYSSVAEIISPLTNFSSRKNEYAADNFAAKLCNSGEPLITGLIKLNADNLSELLPPAFYVFWNFSHPSLIQRVEKLKCFVPQPTDSANTNQAEATE